MGRVQSSKIAFFTAVLLIGAFALLQQGSDTDFSGLEELEDIKEASNVSECVKAPTNYCGCASGGEFTAINREYREDYMEWYESNRPREPVSCPAVYSCYNYTKVLENGSCGLEKGELVK